MNYILTENSLTVVKNDSIPVTLHRGETGETVWAEALQAVKDGNFEAVLRYLNRGQHVHEYFAGQGITIKEGVLYFGDQPMDNYPARKAVQFAQQELPHEALIAFLNRLTSNPSYRAVQDLYSFLEFNQMPLTEDGCFLAYKKVRSIEVDHPINDYSSLTERRAEYRDVFSGSIRNNIGDVIQMARNEVDEDPNRTCSAGLHVCSYDYLPAFGNGPWEAVVVVKIDPADVVAIPIDYNNAKMRVCKYEVVDTVNNYREEGHVLGQNPLFRGYGPNFESHDEYDHGDDLDEEPGADDDTEERGDPEADAAGFSWLGSRRHFTNRFS